MGQKHRTGRVSRQGDVKAAIIEHRFIAETEGVEHGFDLIPNADAVQPEPVLSCKTLRHFMLPRHHHRSGQTAFHATALPAHRMQAKERCHRLFDLLWSCGFDHRVKVALELLAPAGNIRSHLPC